MSNPSKIIVTSQYGVDQDSETPNKFSVELPNSISDVGNVELLSGSMVYTPKHPSLNPLNNNLFIQVQSPPAPPVAQKIELNEFEYFPNITTFLAKLNSAISTAYGGAPAIQFNFNTETQTLEIECLVANRVVEFAGHPVFGAITSTSQYLYRRLGFALFDQNIDPYFTPSAYRQNNFGIRFDYTFTVVGEKVILPNPPNILRTSTVYVASESLANDCLLPRGLPITSIMAQIPLTASTYGSVINYEMSNDQERTTTFDNNVSFVNITLLDDDFNALDMKQNSRISLVFGIHYRDGVPFSTRIIS